MSADDITPTSRGQSFRGRSLEGADFTRADVRGADFTNADLRSASFRDARVGSVPWIRTAILAMAIAASVGAGVLIGLAVEGTHERLSSDDFDEVLVAGIVIVTLIVLVGIVLWRGFDPALKAAAGVYLALVAGTIVANLIWEDVEWQAVIRATLVVWAFVFGIWAGIVSRLTVGFFGRWAVAVMMVLGAFASGRVEGGLAGFVLALTVSHFSRRAVHGDVRDVRLSTLASHLVRRRGTRFVDADLTDTDFRGVDITRCDITGATLEGARWDPGQMPSGEVENDTP
jgi:hypothetical protein